jgi:aspartokinase/homoserine dehydrogenase 1
MTLEVWKFGGASLADAAAIDRAVTLVSGHKGRLVVVASALAGVTDLLLDGARRASAGDGSGAARLAADFLRRHRDIASELLPRGPARRKLLASIDAAAREYRELCHAVAALGHLSPRASDLLVARGERISAALLAAILSDRKHRAAAVDARDVIVTDGHHGVATPNVAATRIQARRVLQPLLNRRIIPVVPGFTGKAPDGSITTLGRGGTDLTATLVGRALSARRIVLWKDVPGILTADPRKVPDARLIPQLHHREAAEVAYYGAKVLHPRALIPIAGTRIVLHVRSFLRPDREGTEVSSRRTLPGHPVKAVASVTGQAVVTVAGKGMMGVPGIAARTFAAVEAERLSVSTIFQASSESSIGFTVPDAEAPLAVAAIRNAFREELTAGLIDDVVARPGVAVMAIVGDGMVGTPGIAARLFSTLAEGHVNIVAIAQGSSERNISFVVDTKDEAEAARRAHAAFQLSKIGGGRPATEPRSDVVILGFGRVGRVLADQIAARDGGPEIRVIGLVDRSGYVFDPRGISRQRLLRLARDKHAGKLLASLGGRRAEAGEALAEIGSHAVSRPLLVDVTADDTSDLLRAAVRHGFDVILANKKPLAGSLAGFDALLSAADDAGRRIRYEATVGAGLPIIDTYRKLVETGDRVLRIDGCVSGTLTYVLSAVSAGRPFSEAIREAVERGYAEPDPREDLSGQDAGRKGLILARLLGYRGAAPKPEALFPARLKRLTREEFLEYLPSLDEEWRKRVARAAAQHRALRYVVTATPRSVSAGLVAVPASSPIGSLQGTRNLIAFTTRRYRAEPLVIMGPGAGAEVTAAGILNDIDYLAGPQ